MFMHRSDVDIRYTAFVDLGRTKALQWVESTTFDANGNPTFVSANQIGRYPLHLHHVIGTFPANASGYQFTLIGNAIDGGTGARDNKWGIAIHDSHYGLIRGNVVYNVTGAGIVAEDGSEYHNVFEKNMVARVTGSGDRGDGRMGPNQPGRVADFAHDGVGFWFRGTQNYVRDNVAAAIHGIGPDAHYGYKFFPYFIGGVKIPNFPGADTANPAEATLKVGTMAIVEFARNECYGSQSALTYWWIGTQNDFQILPGEPQSVIKDLHSWNVYNKAIFHYPSYNVLIDGLVVRNSGDPETSACCNMAYDPQDYMAHTIIIRNADVQNVQTFGFSSTFSGNGDQVFEDSQIQAMTGLNIGSQWSSSAWSYHITPRRTIISNVKFSPIPGKPFSKINLGFSGPYNSNNDPVVVNIVAKDEIFIYGHDRVPGKDYQLFYTQQKPDFVVPKSIVQGQGPFTMYTASPESGLSNQQNWDKYAAFVPGSVPGALKANPNDPGLAIAGAIAPCQDAPCSNSLSLSNVNGALVFPAVLPTTFRIKKPGVQDMVSGTNVTVTYEVIGDQTGVDHVHFSLDGAPEVRDLDFDGTYTFTNATPGNHTLTGYVARADHSKISGTDVSVTFRSTLNKQPVVDAGADIVVPAGSQATLAGTVSDDGEPSPANVTVSWSKMNGPGNVTFTNALSAQTNASFSAAGRYDLQLTADDGEFKVTDGVTVTISAGPGGAGPGGVSADFVLEDGDNQPLKIPSNGQEVKIYTRDYKQNIRTLASTGGLDYVLWNGRNDGGKRVSAGIYLAKTNLRIIKLLVLPSSQH